MEGGSRGFNSTTLDRRRFLKLGGVGLAGVTLFGVLGSSRVTAQQGSLRLEFRQAAEEYKVPLALLMAMGYVNTRWEMPPLELSDYEGKGSKGKGIYGIMALTRNPDSDTLGEASELTSIPVGTLKTDRLSNIKGGAALLSAAQGDKPFRLGEWLGGVDGQGGRGRMVQAIGGVGGGPLYVDQVLMTLRSGVSETISTGERVTLPPQSTDSPAEGVS